MSERCVRRVESVVLKVSGSWTTLYLSGHCWVRVPTSNTNLGGSERDARAGEWPPWTPEEGSNPSPSANFTSCESAQSLGLLRLDTVANDTMRFSFPGESTRRGMFKNLWRSRKLNVHRFVNTNKRINNEKGTTQRTS